MIRCICPIQRWWLLRTHRLRQLLFRKDHGEPRSIRLAGSIEEIHAIPPNMLQVLSIHQRTFQWGSMNPSNSACYNDRTAITLRRTDEIALRSDSMRSKEVVTAKPVKLKIILIANHDSRHGDLIIRIMISHLMSVASLPVQKARFSEFREHTTSRGVDVCVHTTRELNIVVRHFEAIQNIVVSIFVTGKDVSVNDERIVERKVRIVIIHESSILFLLYLKRLGCVLVQ